MYFLHPDIYESVPGDSNVRNISEKVFKKYIQPSLKIICLHIATDMSPVSALIIIIAYSM